MSEREAVERLKERIYKHNLKTKGRLPSAKETREIERTAQKTGERVDNRNKRK